MMIENLPGLAFLLGKAEGEWVSTVTLARLNPKIMQLTS